MATSNEFRAAALKEAVRNATMVYKRSGTIDERRQRRCNDLLLQMNHLSRQAGRHADEAERLADQAESLRREAIASGLLAIASLLGGLAASLIKGGRIARALSRMRKGNLSRETILEFLQIFGPIAFAASALLTAQKFLDSQELARRAQELSARAESDGEAYLAAFDEYDRIGCGESVGFTGS